jgi:hypothetical protein
MATNYVETHSLDGSPLGLLVLEIVARQAGGKHGTSFQGAFEKQSGKGESLWRFLRLSFGSRVVKSRPL